MSATWLRRLITVALLAGLVLLGFRVMDPFIVPLVWAGDPRLRELARRTSGCCARFAGACVIAALLMTVAVSVAVIVPLAWLAVVLRIEVVRAYHATQTLLAGGLQLPPALLKLPWIGDQLRDLSARMAQDPNALGLELRKITDHSFVEIAHVLGGVSRNAVKLFFAVLSLFFVYRDGEKFASQFGARAGTGARPARPQLHRRPSDPR